jgi:hypothetical protein
MAQFIGAIGKDRRKSSEERIVGAFIRRGWWPIRNADQSAATRLSIGHLRNHQCGVIGTPSYSSFWKGSWKGFARERPLWPLSSSVPSRKSA